MSWGNPDYGGESSAVERELVDVRVVEATSERMDLWLAGATQTWVVTARLFGID